MKMSKKNKQLKDKFLEELKVERKTDADWFRIADTVQNLVDNNAIHVVEDTLRGGVLSGSDHVTLGDILYSVCYRPLVSSKDPMLFLCPFAFLITAQIPYGQALDNFPFRLPRTASKLVNGGLLRKILGMKQYKFNADKRLYRADTALWKNGTAVRKYLIGGGVLSDDVYKPPSRKEILASKGCPHNFMLNRIMVAYVLIPAEDVEKYAHITNTRWEEHLTSLKKVVEKDFKDSGFENCAIIIEPYFVQLFDVPDYTTYMSNLHGLEQIVYHAMEDLSEDARRHLVCNIADSMDGNLVVDAHLSGMPEQKLFRYIWLITDRKDVADEKKIITQTITRFSTEVNDGSGHCSAPALQRGGRPFRRKTTLH